MESTSLSNPYGSSLFAGYGQGQSNATAMSPQLQPKKSSNSTVIWIVIAIVLIVLLIIIITWVMWPTSSNSVTTVTYSGREVTPTVVVQPSRILSLEQVPAAVAVGSAQVAADQAQNNTAVNNTAVTTQSQPQDAANSDNALSSDRSDLLANVNDVNAMPSIWIGNTTQSEDNYLVTPDYGYFYPRLVNGVLVRPVVDSAAIDDKTLYAHVSTDGLQGIYKVATDVEGAKWQLLVGTGAHRDGNCISSDESLDCDEGNSVKDLYVNSGNLYAVTEAGIYRVQSGKAMLIDKTQGLIGGDSKGGNSIHLTQDDTLVSNGKVLMSGDGSIRDDVPSYVKYIDAGRGVYAFASRDASGQVGYSSGKWNERFAQMPANVKAFTASDGYFCCVDTDGRVIINEYDGNAFKHQGGIPYSVTVPVDDEFQVATTMNVDKAYIFSSYKERQQR